ncbi:HAD family hydrolase [Novosphingobium guangzhouense]|uniref:Haloacid dehalogenase n=1 Tax=Novosphingobium guangzhouense TaxID=1850347 RepID=A0A2K2G4H3_9SPHN|nr:HAD family phosphatase [Novosphingobium guangzhouense]PNU05939.1 haloacid dehalogenase [Novosphingobium guangzhouense]
MATIPNSIPDPVRAAIFDMDGTLIATEAAHHRSYALTAEAIGWPLGEDVLDAMVGISRDLNEKMLAERLGPEFPLARFYDEADALFMAMLDRGVELRPGAVLILEHFRASGIPMALCTSTNGGLAERRLEKAGLIDYFDVIVTRSDVIEPKPSPEPYLLAASRLGIDPAHCLAVEDSYAGVLSATSAGIPTVMVPDLLPATDEMAAAGALVLPSLDALRDLLMAPVDS